VLADLEVGQGKTMVDHPQRAIVGLRLLLKCGLDWIYRFGDIAIFVFRRLGLKLPIHAHLGVSGDIVFLQMTSRRHPSS